MSNSKTLAQRIKSFGKLVVHYGPNKGETIRILEHQLGIKFPSDYRQFLGNYGGLSLGSILILGLGNELIDLLPAKLHLHEILPNLSLDFVPIEILNERQYVGFISSGKSSSFPILLLDLENPEIFQEIASTFVDYLNKRLDEVESPEETHNSTDVSIAFDIFEQHVLRYQEQFKYDHASGGKLPRNHDWRPYRFCVQDVLFGAAVVRHERLSNSLEVDVFLTAHPENYDKLAGAQALTAFMLSEAYKCGGTMEIRFTRNVEGGRIPAEIKELAMRYNLKFQEQQFGQIAADEAKALYAALTDITPALQERLLQTGRIRLERACFVVHHGIWTLEQMELLALGSPQPESILSGMMQPHQRHLYLRDILHVRTALLAGTLDRRLQKRDHIEADRQTFDLEDDIRLLEIGFDSAFAARLYKSPEQIELQWGIDKHSYSIGANQAFVVLLRPRDLMDIVLHYRADIKAAVSYRESKNNPSVFILFAQDFRALPKRDRLMINNLALENNIQLMICPEYVNTFDREGMQKLARSRVLRQ